jgi:hypothetical protein
MIPNESNKLPQAMEREDIDSIMEEEHCCHENSCTTLLSLPSEVLISQLTYLSIQDVEQSVKFTCKLIFKLCNTQHLWQEYCQQTGKLETPNSSLITNSNDDMTDSINYKELYMSTPCVPIDFSTIKKALQSYPSMKKELQLSKFTITLMPGVYYEQILLDYSDPLFSDSNGSLHEIHIRAAFHDKGAAIVHHNLSDINEPCVSITNRNGDNSNSVEGSVALQNIQFLHFTRGNDIWNGNCALQVDGSNVKVNVLSCSFQSDSGRGVGK